MPRQRLQNDTRADVIWSPPDSSDLVFSVWINAAQKQAFTVQITLAGHPILEKTSIPADKVISLGNVNSPLQGKLSLSSNEVEGRNILNLVGLKYPNGGAFSPTSAGFFPNWSPPDYPDLVFSVVAIANPEPAFSAVINYRGQPFLEGTLNTAQPSIPFSLSDEDMPEKPFIKGQLNYTVLSGGVIELTVTDLQYPGGSVTSQFLASIPVTSTPVILPASGDYTAPQTVTITDDTEGALIYYTTDGSTPTITSTLYSGSFMVSASGTTIVKAIAEVTGSMASPPAIASYTLVLP